MNQRKIRAYIRDHLYLADDAFVRSAEEAEKLARGCSVSARGLVQMAQSRSALPAEAWAGFHRALDREEERQRKRGNSRWNDMAQSLLRHRHAAIATLLILITVAFFTLVPAGRAIAKGIFDYVIGVSGGQLEIEQREEKALYESRGYDTPETLPPEAQESLEAGEELKIISDPVYFDSIADFEQTYQLDAFSFESDQLTLVEVYETNHMFTGKTLRSNYLDQNGGAVNVSEQWYTGDGNTTSSNSDFLEHTVLDGRTMHYTIDAVDGSFSGIVLLDHTILTVYADASVSLDFVWELLA